MLDLVEGTVTDATSSTKPDVRLDGDTEGQPTKNYVTGWTPVNADRVWVFVRNGKRLYIDRVVP
jgi:hypothetical protein